MVRRWAMAKARSNGTADRPLFKEGDQVRFPFGAGIVTGQVVEDRGRLGVGGRRLYGIHFEMNPGEQAYIEMPEEELTRTTGTHRGSEKG
jgi:hypothetical protein